MPKSARRGGRKNANALCHVRNKRRSLDRILDTPQVARVVSHLQPEVLHQIIKTCGLEDCGDLVALVTPAQLQRVFDLDLWRPARAGGDEQLDSDRFAVWLDVLMESGAAVAAQKLVGMDADLVIAALAQHVLVFDRAAVSPLAVDGAEVAEDGRPGDRLSCEIGNYSVEAKRTDAWATIVDLLLFLDAEHPDYFHRVMGECRRLSNSGFEVDGLHDLLTDGEQDLFDLTVDREQRREKQGYATPAQARAFLQSARKLQVGLGEAPPPSPLAHAYFLGIEWTTEPAPPPAPKETTDGIAGVVEILVEAGVLTKPPRALLNASGNEEPRLERIQTHMQLVRDIDDVAYSMRTAELAYLANAVVAGCSIQSRPLTPREASDATAAICNLGLENWPTQWLSKNANRISSVVAAGTALDEDFLVAHDLVGVFQVGWAVLHQNVCMYAAERLIHVLADVRSDDRQTQAGLDALRFEMARHWRAGAPWRAREALEVILFLDKPAWATLLGLIDECPVIHAAIGASQGSSPVSISASAFEFISENRQIASVRDFMQSLPEILRA